MRIGLIGDVHQEDLALGWALGRLQDEDVDLVVCAGDIVDGHGDLNACCELLESHGVITVRGNHDRWFLAQEMRDLPQAVPLSAASSASRLWLSGLRATESLDTPAGSALLCHGLGEDDMAMLGPEHAGEKLEFNEPLQRLLRERRWSLVICGHTHQPMQRRVADLTIVNAGTLHRDYAALIGVLDTRRLETQFIPVPKFNRES